MTTESTDLDLSRYIVLSKVGEGSFSVVYRVKDQLNQSYYAAKVAKFMINEDTIDSEEANLLFREVNLMSSFNHPSILKFVGYYTTNFEDDPVPTLITEFASNGSLRYLIELEKQGLSPREWDITKKLIIIYGIASGMSYLHTHKVLHRDLKPENILIDDYLHPKIADFGLSKLTDFLSVSMNYQSQRGVKGTPAYTSPEILRNEEYSTAGDVYAFAFIVFEIMTGEDPYENVSYYQLLKKVIDGYRPTIGTDVPDSYRDLIESCWSQEPSERPSFDEIVSNLKENNGFITESTDKSEFLDYVDFVDNYQSTFDISKRVIHFSEFIEDHGRNKTIPKFAFKKTELSEDEIIATNKLIQTNFQSTKDNITSITDETSKFSESSYKKIILDERQRKIHEEIASVKKPQKVHEEITSDEKPQKIHEEIASDENESNSNSIEEVDQQMNSKEFIYPMSEFKNLTKNCQILVKESKTDPSKQFIVGKSLIEGTNEFPKNVKVGIQYIEESIKHNFTESIIYYCELLIKGNIIPRDLQKSNKYLSKIDTTQNGRILLLKGKISYKQNKFRNSAKYFEEGMKIGDKECMYQYGKMYFIGGGVMKNEKKALKYISKSKDLGYLKADYFLQSYNPLIQIKEFNTLQSEIQLIFISNNIKNKEKQCSTGFDQIFLKPKATEKLFFNKSLASSSFIKCLSKYKKIAIEIEYPSASFEKIVDLVEKIKETKIIYIKIGISFSSFAGTISHRCFSEKISYQKIDNSVHEIPYKAFENTSLTQISIPSTVTSIRNSAFIYCSSLTQLSIPSSITSIGNKVCKGCSSLTQISIPSSITTIGDSAFDECTLLKQILFEIPSSLTTIGNNAFSGCSSLTEISIPSSVTSIGNYVFEGCSSLTEISIPSSVTSIGNNAFDGCSSLTQISIPFFVTSIGDSVFDGCTLLKQILFEIPSSLTTIGNNAFSGCSSLTEISIPSSVASIGNKFFFRCSSLTEISIPSSVTSIGNNAFDGCSSLKEISFPSSISYIGKYAFCRCSSLVQISIPSSVTEIGEGYFYGCKSLAQILIPSSVTSIGNYAFNECSSLAQISIPSSVTSIRNYAFCRCSSLVQISIPSSVTSIGDSVFDECALLKQISFEVPSYLNKIGNNVFSGCSSLTQISIPSSITGIGDRVFSKCSSLIQISIPSSVTLIGNSAFYECSSLTQISIPSSVSYIRSYAFYGCLSLTQISIPSSVTSIGDYVFFGCSSLTEISIPSSVTSIGANSFFGCSSLTQISIPSSITKIGESAFDFCFSLKQISIPSSITEIGDYAFNKCSSLEQISFEHPSSLTSIGKNVFNGCTSLKQVIIPKYFNNNIEEAFIHTNANILRI